LPCAKPQPTGCAKVLCSTAQKGAISLIMRIWKFTKRPFGSSLGSIPCWLSSHAAQICERSLISQPQQSLSTSLKVMAGFPERISQNFIELLQGHNSSVSLLDLATGTFLKEEHVLRRVANAPPCGRHAYSIVKGGYPCVTHLPPPLPDHPYRHPLPVHTYPPPYPTTQPTLTRPPLPATSPTTLTPSLTRPHLPATLPDHLTATLTDHHLPATSPDHPNPPPSPDLPLPPPSPDHPYPPPLPDHPLPHPCRPPLPPPLPDHPYPPPLPDHPYRHPYRPPLPATLPDHPYPPPLPDHSYPATLPRPPFPDHPSPIRLHCIRPAGSFTCKK
jgi:hypothetical protein